MAFSNNKPSATGEQQPAADSAGNVTRLGWRVKFGKTRRHLHGARLALEFIRTPPLRRQTVARKPLNPTSSKKDPKVTKKGAPPNEQDSKRRLGTFVTAGEHSRQGGRSTGIVGQTKQKNKTDKKGGKK
jgi:hypothetical protein